MSDYKKIEAKWQKKWEDEKSFVADNNSTKEKYYYLVEFPYPSGAGLHVGHCRSYTALDALARKKRMNGYNVLFPMGWDAFGAPAEQYAIKNHIHPSVAVKENIKTFKGQVKSLGLSIDWTREFSTTDPEYYKWTQWQFLKFFEKGMAYKAKKNINWCPNCKMGLSNEDSSGGVCERCGHSVEQREKEQWMLRMSDYAEDLIKGLDDTDFQERIKTAQINWIGKSEGAEVNFKVKETNEDLVVYTTRPDTLYGVTFMVVAPEHPIIEKNKNIISNMDEINSYKDAAKNKTEFERTQVNKDKTGVKIEGLTGINPITKKEIPIYISDYVMMNYGTGAIMAVPAHDERDFEFANKFGIDIIPVIEQITGTPRDDEKKKNSIVAVLFDEENNKYLTINWGNLGGRLFVGGTRKDNESPLECAIREIKEETGYTDITYMHDIFPINHHYYAHNKNQAYEIESTGLLFKLNSNKKVEVELDDDEKDNFKVEWVDKNKIEKEVVDELHITTFRNLLKPTAYIADGKMVNSDILNGLTNKKDSIEKMLEYLEENNLGKRKTNYKLQDWIFSRQRFWGEPIPLVHCKDCGWVAVDDKDLPVTLPEVVNYEPTDDGESPLAAITDWVNTTCPKCGNPAKRETDTMPNWAGSSWYWLRYMDAHNDKEFASKDALKYWGKLDFYNGGMEHTTLHLLYSRFWHKFLYDQKVVPTPEPYQKRTSHGMILGENGEKMSKSRGNVVNPDDIVRDYGADTLRTYEMFIGAFDLSASWSDDGVKGCRRFLDRVWKLQTILTDGEEYSKDLEIKMHQTIKKVSSDFENLKFNTAIAAMMALINEFYKKNEVTRGEFKTLITLLNPVAPHITEEIWSNLGCEGRLYQQPWPEYEEAKTVEATVEIAVQINGKTKATVSVGKEEQKEAVLAKAKEVLGGRLSGNIVKEIYVPGRIVNLVVK